MKLDHARTQDELMQLTDKELRRNLFAQSPLNLPRVFLYALYFVLLPAAILGPVPGIAGTAVLAGVAAYLWLWSTPQALDSFLWFWLIWAAVDWALLLMFRFVMGVWEYCQFKDFLQAEAEDEPDLNPGGRIVRELEKGESHKLPLVVQVPRRGVYILKVAVEEGNSQINVGFDGCACMEEHECVPGLTNAHAAAYRLEPGCHLLSVLVQARSAARLAVSFR